ncbi:type IV pilus twitching motility protein PilT [Deinococcus yavapaiensis]|uniref:Twitching motility protein PilT n=1 Tax=Deinococcus yavapaiensis KR-236 TaxID=694435 RepID=A0A318SFK1_9DEIO|nr:PilT/PilU family type 4a pilus ATPase [Deinococcus yavapaiensis]PYE56224.1 twitching motility protein PilT [Deinococcus yavapaiensis KR-236]
MKLPDLLKHMVQMRASDLHFRAGSPPLARVDGELRRFGENLLSASTALAIAKQMMSDEQWTLFERSNEADFAYSLSGIARFRVNAFRQRGSVAVVMRVVSDHIPSMGELGLPVPVLQEWSNHERGLILVTGPTGSGKTTTLASLIDYINGMHAHNIITIEDPIEVLYQNKKSVVAQREIGSDTADFRVALRAAMRQDPDVILIGEMRDKETVEAALSAAQTGHLVLSTLHTLDSVRTVNRVIDFFAPHERPQIRLMLAEALVGIHSQRLLSRKDGGRVLASEVLVATPLVKDYIKDEDKTLLLKEVLMEDNVRGMRTFDQHLAELYEDKVITLEEALSAATSPAEVRLMLTRRGVALGT